MLPSAFIFPPRRFAKTAVWLFLSAALSAPAVADSDNAANSSGDSNSATSKNHNVELLPAVGLEALTAAALAKNPQLAGRRFGLESARESRKISRAALLPSVAAGASKILEKEINPGLKDSVHLSLTQAVFNLPLWQKYQSDQLKTRAAEHAFAAEIQTLRLSVMEAWLDFQFAADAARLTETRIALAEQQAERAQSFAEAGVGTEVDVLDSKARLASLRADLLQNRHDIRLVQDRIYNLSGRRAKRVLLAEDAPARFPPLSPLGRWLNRAAEKSLSLAEARAELESAQKLVQAADLAIAPRAALRVESRAEGGLSKHKESVILSFEQSLFAGGGLRAEARRAALGAQAARQNTYAVKQRDELRARELHGRAALARSRRRALAAADSAAAAALAAVTAGYENGARLASDVLDAEETLFDARLQLRQTHYQYLKDIAALHALAGMADDDLARAVAALFRDAEGGEEEEDIDV